MSRNPQARLISPAIFLVHGGFSGWSPWVECSSSCGGGVSTRSRLCDNPAPKYGGKDCSTAGLGSTVESKACNSFPCQGKGGIMGVLPIILKSWSFRLDMHFSAQVQICSRSGRTGASVTKSAAVGSVSEKELAPLPCQMQAVKIVAYVGLLLKWRNVIWNPVRVGFAKSWVYVF